MKKIIFMLMVIILSFTLLCGCTNGDLPNVQNGNNVNSGEKITLNVYNWGDYIDETVLDDFKAEYGINVNYENFPTNEEMYIKLNAGGTKYDVLFPSDYMIEKLIKEDKLYELDFNNIPNFKYIDNRFKKLAYDPENKYSVPYFWGTLGILYNKNVITEAPESWDILWDDKYSGSIVMLDSMRDTIAVALKKLGYSINTRNPEEIEKAKQLLIEQKDKVYGYYVDEIKDIMINEEAVLAIEWSGDAIDVFYQEADYIGYSVPKEGSNLWSDCMVIPKISEHKKEAEIFINFMTDPEIAYKNTAYVGYATTNKETYKKMLEEDPEVATMDAYWPSDDILDRCEVFYDLGDFTKVYGDAWTEIQAK